MYFAWILRQVNHLTVLMNNWFLHMNDVLARTVDALVVSKMKQKLVDSSSIYQVGRLPGHSIHKHLLNLKTVMAGMKENKRGFIFLAIDFVSFFDRKDIFNCLETLDKIEVHEKAKRLWYPLKKRHKDSSKNSPWHE